MEQPGGRTPDSGLSGSKYWLVNIGGAATIGTGLALYYVYQGFPKGTSRDTWGISVVVTVLVTSFLSGFTSWRQHTLATADEALARERVRQAEDNLANALRSDHSKSVIMAAPAPSEEEMRAALLRVRRFRSSQDDDTVEFDRPGYSVRGEGDENDEAENPEAEREFPERLLPFFELAPSKPVKKQRDDDLALAALWEVTHRRLDLYHQIVTRQARKSFGAAQVTMAIGFILLIVFAVLAMRARTATAAVSAGGLGAVGAAFAAYIGKTFIRSQESAASHLQAYFDQPLELSRYLAAERLLADAKDLMPEQRAAILGSLVQSIATAGHENGKVKGKPE